VSKEDEEQAKSVAGAYNKMEAEDLEKMYI